jgi:hypothetical protein
MRTVTEVPVDAAAELLATGFELDTDENGSSFVFQIGRHNIRVEQDPEGWWAYRATTLGFMVLVCPDATHVTNLADAVPAALRWIAEIRKVMRTNVADFLAEATASGGRSA